MGHYITVVRPVNLDGNEVALYVEKSLKLERSIVRKIHWPKMTEEEYKLESNKEILTKSRRIRDGEVYVSWDICSE